jgi:hypothetical protein
MSVWHSFREVIVLSSWKASCMAIAVASRHTTSSATVVLRPQCFLFWPLACPIPPKFVQGTESPRQVPEVTRQPDHKAPVKKRRFPNLRGSLSLFVSATKRCPGTFPPTNWSSKENAGLQCKRFRRCYIMDYLQDDTAHNFPRKTRTRSRVALLESLFPSAVYRG